MKNGTLKYIIKARRNHNGVVAKILLKCTQGKGGVMMKKMLVVLLACLAACSLCACATKCVVYEECGKKIEKSSENENPLGKGHLCEEHLEDATRRAEEIEASGESVEEYMEKYFDGK